MKDDSRGSRERVRDLTFPIGDGLAIHVRIGYSANTVIVVPVPPRPSQDDYTYSIVRAGPDHHVAVEVGLVRG